VQEHVQHGGLALAAAPSVCWTIRPTCAGWSSADAARGSLCGSLLVFQRDLTLAWRRWDEVAQPLIST